jgi:predicted ribosome quality control (RQC) complex YloA/Tae2 family protein
MKVELDITKSIYENAADYYEKSKEARQKIKGLRQAISETEKEIEAAKEEKVEEKARIKREKKWFEKFNWFKTSGGKLAIGGRSAQQNDQVFQKHMEDNDLFFHADIQGGSAVILKEGIDARDQEMLETAQFAASFSKAWMNGNAAVDVYAVSKGQLSKHSQGGFIPAGAFEITGERQWFRNTRLAIRVGKGEEMVEAVPECSKRELDSEVHLVPSKTGKEKGKIAKELAKKFDAHPDDLLSVLPNGKSRIPK